MFSTRQVGSLAVVEQTQERKAIERELSRLDRNLFLDAEIVFTRGGEKMFMWTVKEHIGSEHPPHLVLMWRDENGQPLPLTHGLVEQVKRLDGAGHTVFAEVDAHNQHLRDVRAADSEYAYEEITRDMLPRISETRSAVLPRGVYLRMSRDKRRARGEKC